MKAKQQCCAAPPEDLRYAEGAAPAYDLSGEQKRFLYLHSRTHDYVNRWQLLLGDMYCRATTCCGHTATIHVEQLAELIRDGLMDMVGEHGARITAAGLGAV